MRRLDVASLVLLMIGLIFGGLAYWLIANQGMNPLVIVPSIVAATSGATHIFKRRAPHVARIYKGAPALELTLSGDERITVLVNSNAKMSRGKAAAQAVHAVLNLYGIPHGVVVVLGGSPAEIASMPVQIRDAGRTEIEPGTLTAGARFAASLRDLAKAGLHKETLADLASND